MQPMWAINNTIVDCLLKGIVLPGLMGIITTHNGNSEYALANPYNGMGKRYFYKSMSKYKLSRTF